MDSKYHTIFEIKGLPKTVNALGRKHWAIKKKHNDDWTKQVFFALFGGNGLPDKPLKSATITLTRCSSSEPDFDGLVSSFKVILDSLTRVGVIEDDKPSIIGTPTYVWQQCKQKQGKIRVEITEK